MLCFAMSGVQSAETVRENRSGVTCTFSETPGCSVSKADKSGTVTNLLLIRLREVITGKFCKKTCHLICWLILPIHSDFHCCAFLFFLVVDVFFNWQLLENHLEAILFISRHEHKRTMLCTLSPLVVKVV